MSTLNQHLTFKNIRKIKKNRATLLKNKPQIRGAVLKLRIQTPKKPNSARRPVAKIGIFKTLKKIIAHIPGLGHNLRKHSEVLLGGVGCKDLPGINYTCIKGVYDFAGSLKKLKRRSIYGTKLPDKYKKKLRRKFRII